MINRFQLVRSASAALFGLWLVACSGEDPQAVAADQNEPGAAPVRITGAGATFPEPLYERWIQTYSDVNPDVAFSYGGVGSGEGIKRFLAEDVDFGASDAAMRDAELAEVAERGATMEVNDDRGVAQRVTISAGSINDVEYEFAERLGLPVATLQNKVVPMVAPSPAAGTAALASAEQIPEDLRVFVPDPPGGDAYPIVRYAWLLLHGSYPDPNKTMALRDAITWG